MKKTAIIFLLTTFVLPAFTITANSQDRYTKPQLFIGGGALPEAMYKEFLKLTGTNAKLVVVPTASRRDVDTKQIQRLWKSRGFKDISVLHTNNKKVASSTEFIAPLKTATAVWFSGGSQQRIADAYLGTLMEKELYKLLNRGGVIGGTSAGAAIQSRVMIKSGSEEPKISTGFKLFPGAILDQHFLKRNRFPRLIKAIKAYPKLIGFGIDEGTAIVVSGNNYKVVGASYVIRIASVKGSIKIDAYKNGDTIPLTFSGKKDLREHNKNLKLK